MHVPAVLRASDSQSMRAEVREQRPLKDERNKYESMEMKRHNAENKPEWNDGAS